MADVDASAILDGYVAGHDIASLSKAPLYQLQREASSLSPTFLCMTMLQCQPSGGLVFCDTPFKVGSRALCVMNSLRVPINGGAGHRLRQEPCRARPPLYAVVYGT